MNSYTFFNDRKSYLQKLAESFENIFQELNQRSEATEHLYWDSIYGDDAEHYLGTAFITFHNYIKSTFNEVIPDNSYSNQIYRLGRFIKNSDVTDLELIIACSNFYKHRDDGKQLLKHTTKPFEKLSIRYSTQDDKANYKIGSESPLFHCFEILTNDFKILEISERLIEWTEELYIHYKPKFEKIGEL